MPFAQLAAALALMSARLAYPGRFPDLAVNLRSSLPAEITFGEAVVLAGVKLPPD